MERDADPWAKENMIGTSPVRRYYLTDLRMDDSPSTEPDDNASSNGCYGSASGRLNAV
jgi:hypothetical protein